MKTVGQLLTPFILKHSRLLCLLSNCMERSSRLSEADARYLNFLFQESIENILFKNFMNNVFTFQELTSKILWFDVHCTRLRDNSWGDVIEMSV